MFYKHKNNIQQHIRLNQDNKVNNMFTDLMSDKQIRITICMCVCVVNICEM